MAECDLPPSIPCCWSNGPNDRELLGIIAWELCQVLHTGIPAGAPVGIQDVNVVSSVTLTVQGDTGRTWNLDFLTDQVDVTGSVVGVTGSVGRTWDLDFLTDQVDVSGSSVSVSNFPASFGVTQITSPWVVSGTVAVSNFPVTQPVSGTVTALQGTIPWTVDGTVAATQSGVWTTGRTWDLGFATDQVDVTGSAVSVTNFPATQVVSATDFDIRNLVFATDKVDVSGSVVALDAASLAALETVTVLQGTSPWVVNGTFTPSGTQDVNIISSITLTVQATDLDIRNLVFATDKVDASGSSVSVSNFPASQVVTATDLDIRNLVFATDKVDASGSSVSVSNFPATVAVTQSTSPWVVSLASTTITGTVAVTQSTSPWVTNDPGLPNALGQATMAGSTSVTIASDQTAIPISGTVTATPSGTQDVNVIGSITLTVAATDLDIRNLVFATDKVDASGSSVSVSNFPATQPVSGTVTANQGTSPWVTSLASTTITGNVTVIATDLDIRNLVFATDKVDVSGSTVAPVVGTTGGATPFRNAAVTNTAVAVKASAGKVWSYNIFNPGVALAYLHFYDLASGSVVVGTTVPTRSVALQSTATAQVGVDSSFTVGIQFAAAIAIAATTTTGGGTAPGTALVVNIDYA